MDADPDRKAAIAARLALARKQAGLSQAQVAKMLGLHRPSVSEAEAGRRNVTAAEVARLAEIYGVSADWLSCTGVADTDSARDRIELAARELAKLREDDLTKVLDLLQALRKSKTKGEHE
jgi:transcriptional regulator with XRE-family HTH domain